MPIQTRDGINKHFCTSRETCYWTFLIEFDPPCNYLLHSSKYSFPSIKQFNHSSLHSQQKYATVFPQQLFTFAFCIALSLLVLSIYKEWEHLIHVLVCFRHPVTGYLQCARLACEVSCMR